VWGRKWGRPLWSEVVFVGGVISRGIIGVAEATMVRETSTVRKVAGEYMADYC
jgi:hypothetical protein